MEELLIHYNLVIAKKNYAVIRAYIYKDQVGTWKNAHDIMLCKQKIHFD